MDLINANEYTCNQQREWCRVLNLVTHGNKNTLAARLNEVPFRGRCPAVQQQQRQNEADNAQNVLEAVDEANVEADDEANEQEGESNDEQEAAESNEEADGEREEEESNEAANGERKKGKSNEKTNSEQNNGESNEKINDEQQKEKANEKINDEAGKEKTDIDKELKILSDQKLILQNENDFQRARMQLMARELELMKFEKELLQRENDLLRVAGGASSQKISNDDEISFQTIKEMLPDFDGQTSVSVWHAHVNVLKSTYALTENKLRSLIFSKLKGDAQAWVYSKPEFANEKIDTLLLSMEKAFLPKESAIILRKKFEARRWQTNESFSAYFNSKVLLSNGLQMSELELVDYIIHGIPDRQIRTSANMMCFKMKDDLLSALRHVNLVAPKIKGATNSGGKVEKQAFWCYNCNCLGHIASDCRKPKREVGACFVCGKMGHLAAACEQNKKTSAPATRKEDYNVY
ncbi:uncharacterized protein [Drosophila takahashii]|uniref:uncharacterized protein n=1 Tax=Drosophila takahashii TaxID=29030 RepID=UPI003898E7C4